MKSCKIIEKFHSFYNATGKRETPYNRWEPIYIGTNEDPSYDERLTWEGRSDKMVQV